MFTLRVVYDVNKKGREMDAADYQQEVAKLRKRLARALGRSEVPHAVWGYVDSLQLPYAAIMGYVEDWNELVSEARRYMDGSAKVSSTDNESESGQDFEVEDRIEVTLDEYSKRRAGTFSEVAAALAGRRASVRAFRAEHLRGGGTATAEQADDWLQEASQSDLAHLHAVSRELSRVYRWRQKAAGWFILTGDVPFVKPLNVTVHLNSSVDDPNYIDAPYAAPGPRFFVDTADITIVAEPWMDAKHVERAYRQAQQRLLGGKSGRNRKKDYRTLDAVRFAARQINATDRVLWSEVTEKWNQEQRDPGRRYDSRGGLSQAFKRFLRPRYNRPRFNFEPEPWQIRERSSSLSSHQLQPPITILR